MDQLPLVSVIVPAYNSSDFIIPTLKSVISQTYPNWECVVVDDCSRDGTYDLIVSEFGRDSRFKILQLQENGGAGLARNLALENASGRFISFLDADDVWGTEKLTIQVVIMYEEQSAISHTSYNLIDTDDNVLRGGVAADVPVGLTELLKTTPMGTSTVMLDKTVVGDVRFNSMRNRQDLCLWIDILSRGFKSRGIPDCLTSYRVRPHQISANKISMLRKTWPIYMSLTKYSLVRRIYYFLCYMTSAIIKRAKSNG